MPLLVEKSLHKANGYLQDGKLSEVEVIYKEIIFKFSKKNESILGFQNLQVGQ